jgi:hypothetical protein
MPIRLRLMLSLSILLLITGEERVMMTDSVLRSFKKD